MFEKIKICGFKPFKEREISLAKLTVLTGLNNSGKSSVMQALRMCLKQDGKSPYIDGLGGYSEIKSQFTKAGEPVSISIVDNENNETLFELKPESYTHESVRETPLVQFISAERYGPKINLPIIPDDIPELTVGNNGEYSVHYASILENCLISEELRHPNSESRILKHQLGFWMSEISPGVKLDFDVIRRYELSQLGINQIRPTNSGFGISYVLPILLCLLTMSAKMGEDDSNIRAGAWFEKLEKKKCLLLIENPEAHLHPRGQTQVGKLIALAAAAGVQIIIETHSDHVLDGIRLAVKNEKSVKAEDIQIKYFTKSQDSESMITDIKVNPNGKLDHWPNGFFDQYSINLRSLASKTS